MKTTLEIEFKTKITEKKYQELIKMFDLEKDIQAYIIINNTSICARIK